jgi:peptide/nickel transport system permease protein
VDDVVMFIIITRLAIPLILVALAVVSLAGSSLTVVVLTLGLLLWDCVGVVARTMTMNLRTLGRVSAARAAGCSGAWFLGGEVLPNILLRFPVVATLQMALAILLDAVLAFLGLGVPPLRGHPARR